MKIPEETMRLAILLSKPIDDLRLSHRTWNALMRWGIRTVGDLCEAREKGVLPKIRNLGSKSLYEIEHAIDSFLGEV